MATRTANQSYAAPVRGPVRRSGPHQPPCDQRDPAQRDVARGELRATGETIRRREDTAIDRLTPQELQIARLAAEGISNKEIGSRLFMSPRTVESHLYRVFPKLGIGSRVDLRGLPLEDAEAAG